MQWRIQRGAGGHAPLQAHATAHQMSDFKAKMHQIRFRLGLRPRSHLQISFLNILDIILSRASGGSALESGPRWGHMRRLNGARGALPRLCC